MGVGVFAGFHFERNEQAYSRISELLERVRGIDPMKSIEQIYPKLADYGFVLHDSFHQLLFMFITWEGTKRSFRAEDFSPVNPSFD